MKLSQHDARLLVAASGITVAIAYSGEKGIKMLSELARNSDALLRDGINGSINILSSIKEEVDIDSVAEPSSETFADNIARLAAIGSSLAALDMLPADRATFVNEPLTEHEVEVAQPVTPEGTPTAAKQYNGLWLTHDQVHDLGDMLSIAGEAGMPSAIAIYEKIVKLHARIKEEEGSEQH